jgi:mRNA-degrading endonuclease RelE of RelBE toxin-antitoxin system
MNRSEKGLLDESTPWLKIHIRQALRSWKSTTRSTCVWDYRILYQVKGRALLVLIVRIETVGKFIGG